MPPDTITAKANKKSSGDMTVARLNGTFSLTLANSLPIILKVPMLHPPNLEASDP